MIARFSQKGLSHGFLAMAEYLAYPLMMFIATPFFLRWLGQAQYGQWMLVLVFTGFGGLSGLGMGASTVKEVSAASGRNDLQDAAIATRVCLSVTLMSGFAFCVLILMAAYFQGALLFARMGAWVDVWPLFVFAAVLIFVEQVDQVFAGVIRGLQRFDLSAAIESSAKLATVVLAVAAAWFTGNLKVVLLAVTSVTLIRLAVKAVVASRLLGRRVYVPLLRKDRAASIFHFGKWIWLQSVGASIFSTIDRLVVGSFLGSQDLATYSVCLQLAQQIQTLPAAGAQVIFPAVSKRMGAGHDVRKMIVTASLVLAALVIVLGLLVGGFAHTILSTWVGAAFADQSYRLLQLLALAFVILGINVGPHFGLYGMGKAGAVALLNTAAGCMSAAIAVVAIQNQGLIGVGWSRLVFGLFVCLDIVILVMAIRKTPRAQPTHGVTQ